MTEWADVTTVLTLAVFVIYMAGLSWALRSRLGRFHPGTFYPTYWAAILVVSFGAGLHIYPPSAMALSIIAVGVSAFALGVSAASPVDAPSSVETRPLFPVNLGVALAIIAAMFIVGSLLSGPVLSWLLERRSISLMLGRSGMRRTTLAESLAVHTCFSLASALFLFHSYSLRGEVTRAGSMS